MTGAMITALGAVTSVGFDAATACASIRAGLCRPEELIEYTVLDHEAHAPVGVTGHPVSLVTRGFTGVGRWLQMAVLALEDLCRQAELPEPGSASFWAATRCIIVTPILDPERFLLEPPCASEPAVTASLLPPLEERVARFFSPFHTTVWGKGRVGVLEAIAHAEEDFRRQRCERVVVLAVDSHTDGTGLAWLAAQGRLKHDGNPVGLVPGEAAAVFMLEVAWAARARGVHPVAHVVATASARVAERSQEREELPGDVLARAVRSALTASGVKRPYEHETITDLNGEAWRAKDYGHAQVRVPNEIWGGDRVELPAASVGDPGAAMAALELIVGCRALQRGYAGGDQILMTTADEYGHAGAAVLGRAQRGGAR